MRAARLIRMVLLLQSRPGLTAAGLAAELGVSERTVTRDAQALAEVGIPVYADRGRTGGYRLVGGYRTGLTGLARGEAEALFLSGVPGALREMGLEDAASAARLKVSAALLPSLSDAPRTAAQRFHLDAPGWFREPRTPEPLPVVADAVWGDRRITARYRRRAGTGGGEGDGDTGEDAAGQADGDGSASRAGRLVERVLEPYGLVLKAGVWYLCARAEGADAGAGGKAGVAEGAGGSFRVYRIDRFTAVTASQDRFVRDETFDLPRFWAERAVEFARAILRATVVVRLSPQGAWLLPHAVDPVAAREALRTAEAPDAAGLITVTLPVESEDVAYTQLMALGPEAEVLSPAGLRERFARAALRTLALYR